MAEKQGHLNGAYYGPAVPPTRSYHSHGRDRGCGCCGLCCLLSLIVKLVVSIVLIVGLAGLIIWLIFRPINMVKFHVTDAKLSQFNFSTADNMLHYKFAVNVTVRNPNKKIGIFYDRIEARGYYQGRRFHAVDLTPFYQGHKTTSVLTAAFDGQQMVLLGADTSDYNQDKASGVYGIDVKLYLRVRFRLGKLKTGKGWFRPKIDCDLDVPIQGSAAATAAGGFQPRKCDVDY